MGKPQRKRLRSCDYSSDAMHELCELSTFARALQAIECFESIFKNTSFGLREVDTDVDEHRQSRGFQWTVFMSGKDWNDFDAWDRSRIMGAGEVLTIALARLGMGRS